MLRGKNIAVIGSVKSESMKCTNADTASADYDLAKCALKWKRKVQVGKMYYIRNQLADLKRLVVMLKILVYG